MWKMTLGIVAILCMAAAAITPATPATQPATATAPATVPLVDALNAIPKDLLPVKGEMPIKAQQRAAWMAALQGRSVSFEGTVLSVAKVQNEIAVHLNQKGEKIFGSLLAVSVIGIADGTEETRLAALKKGDKVVITGIIVSKLALQSNSSLPLNSPARVNSVDLLQVRLSPATVEKK